MRFKMVVKSITYFVLPSSLPRLGSWIHDCNVMGFALTLSCPPRLSLSDLPGDGVALGALHAAPFPASAPRMALFPALCREDQHQPRPGE